jgi:uncharacterized protein (TIGR00290 family)
VSTRCWGGSADEAGPPLEPLAPPAPGKKHKVLLAWSGGKDSAMALHELRRAGTYDVVALLTTLSEEFQRVSHHGVRVDLLDHQADAVGVPLCKLFLPKERCSNEEYEALMRTTLLEYKDAGVSAVAFGDIFLADLRAYRERTLAQIGMRGVFPLWKRDTAELLGTFIDLGFKARLVCVDAAKLGPRFAGRAIDRQFVADLPVGVDPCGENGEYHSFVHDGPIFRRPVHVKVGEVVQRDVRFFADLLPSHASAETGA